MRSALACAPGELIARHGGEEIIAVLVNRTHEEADEIAQRMVAGVASLNLPHVAPADGNRVTVSIGVVTQFRPSPLRSRSSSSSPMGRYKAKHQGRNRAVVVEAKASVAA